MIRNKYIVQRYRIVLLRVTFIYLFWYICWGMLCSLIIIVNEHLITFYWFNCLATIAIRRSSTSSFWARAADTEPVCSMEQLRRLHTYWSLDESLRHEHTCSTKCGLTGNNNKKAEYLNRISSMRLHLCRRKTTVVEARRDRTWYLTIQDLWYEKTWRVQNSWRSEMLRVTFYSAFSCFVYNIDITVNQLLPYRCE